MLKWNAKSPHNFLHLWHITLYLESSWPESITQKIITSKEELTPERWVFKELKTTFPYTNICQRERKKNSRRKDSRVLQHTWAELPLNTQCFPNPSRKHWACPAAGTLSNFLLHVASFPCLGKCFWYEGTCSFRPQSFHFAGETLESSEQPGNAQGPPQLPVRHGPLSLNLFSTPQPSSDNVWRGIQDSLSVPSYAKNWLLVLFPEPWGVSVGCEMVQTVPGGIFH